MKRRALGWTACSIAAAIVAGASITPTPALAGDTESFAPARIQYSGLLNDYTPSAAVVKGGPYEMRGVWSLEVNQRRGSAIFSAEMNMETSDYGITQNTVNKDDPTTRGAHTHHISMTDGLISDDWTTSCPALSPAAMDGFVIKGTVFVTGNGSPAPFGNPSPVTICVLGGSNVTSSNITVTFGAPANTHFGKQALHGVILKCLGPWEHELHECTCVNDPGGRTQATAGTGVGPVAIDSGAATVESQAFLLTEQHTRPFIVGIHRDQSRALAFHC
jgi:hypothetical protein